jgi:hypothetical protein
MTIVPDLHICKLMHTCLTNSYGNIKGGINLTDLLDNYRLTAFVPFTQCCLLKGTLILGNMFALLILLV